MVTDQLLIRKHHLPHWQMGGSVYYVTFKSSRGDLDDESKRILIEHIRWGNGKKFDLIAAVVMSDHCHLMLKPLPKSQDLNVPLNQREKNVPLHWWDLSEILKGIKGASSRAINQHLGTTGKIWVRESFDRIIRDEKEFEQKLQYICNNPVEAGLVEKPEDYEFLILG